MTEPSGESGALIASALAALRVGSLQKAQELCDRLCASAPQDPATHQLAATVALQRGQFDVAMRWARSCLALRPDHSPALTLAGRAARGAGDLAAAANWFERASRLSPDRAEPAFLHCVTRLEQRDDGAHTMLERLLRDFPDHAWGWNEVATTLRKAGQWEGAAVAFARAANASNEPSHHASSGAALRALKRPGEAVPAFRRALDFAPDRVDFRMALAACLRETGEFRLARIEIERAIAIEAGDSRHWFALGLVCEDLRDPAAAIFAFRRSTELDAAFPEAHVNLGLALQKSGEFEAAMDSYRRAVRLRGNTFGRIAQGLASARKGQVWLNFGRLRRSLGA